MRTICNTLALLLLTAAMAAAQTVVTITGSVVNLDSSRANVLIRTGSRDQLVVLPQGVNVSHRDGRAVTVDNLTKGTRITVDADKSATGQLTARRVVVTTPGGTPADITPPNQRTVTATGTAGDDTRGAQGSLEQGGLAATAVNNRGTGEVRINGRTVFRFRGVGNATAYARAREVARRLNSRAMRNLSPSEVRVVRTSGQWAVIARGQLLITADATTARINRTTPYRLASLWASNVRSRLAAG